MGRILWLLLLWGVAGCGLADPSPGSDALRLTPTAVSPLAPAHNRPHRVPGTRIPVTVAVATSSLVNPATDVPTAVLPEPTAVLNQPAAVTRFSNLRFATTPDGAAQASFAAGTEEVYSIWEYRDMEASDQIRRIWFRNEQIWHVREHAWDVERYGRSGAVTDMRIYDFEGEGLESASYRLQIYLNDVLQIEAGFTVAP